MNEDRLALPRAGDPSPCIGNCLRIDNHLRNQFSLIAPRSWGLCTVKAAQAGDTTPDTHAPQAGCISAVRRMRCHATRAVNRTPDTTVRETRMRCLYKKDQRILVLGQAFHCGRKTNPALEIANKSTLCNAKMRVFILNETHIYYQSPASEIKSRSNRKYHTSAMHILNFSRIRTTRTHSKRQKQNNGALIKQHINIIK